MKASVLKIISFIAIIAICAASMFGFRASLNGDLARLTADLRIVEHQVETLRAQIQNAEEAEANFPAEAGFQELTRLEAEIQLQRLVMTQVEASGIRPVSFGIKVPTRTENLSRVEFEVEVVGSLRAVANLLLAMEQASPRLGLSTLWLRSHNALEASQGEVPVHLRLRVWAFAAKVPT